MRRKNCLLPLTTPAIVSYNKEQSKNESIVCSPVIPESVFPYLIRACTGFDGGFEVEAAIRRLLDCVSTGKLNINADEQYALAA